MIGEKKEQPKNCIPEIDKYCAIFVTLGERRLGTHLLNGFISVIRAITIIAIETFGASEETLSQVLSLYPKERAGGIETFKVTPQHHPPFINGLEQNVNVWCQNPVYEEKDYDRLVLYKTLVANVKVLEKLVKASEQVQEWGKILMLSSHLPEQQQKLMQRTLDALSAARKKSPLEHMMDIYARIGHETGLVKRAMQEADVNWGSFVDHGPISFHCNAHANNFVVLPSVLLNRV